MPKFRVSVSYDQTHHEIYEVELLREDYDSDEDYREALSEFDESPYDFCDETNRTERFNGDIRDSSWDEDVEEINALDQIVEAISDNPK